MILKIDKILLKQRKTYYDLAKITNLDMKAISKIVKNKTKGAKFTTLDKIARALDVSIDELFDREDHS